MCGFKKVYLSEVEYDRSGEEEMRFRLVYQGPLQAKQRDPLNGQTDKLAPHTHAIRQQFHEQLKRLWETNRFLSEHKVWRTDFLKSHGPPSEYAKWAGKDSELEPMVDVVADLYHENGYRFVPLVREDWHLFCDISVLFLRHDIPGGVFHAGDIDNRIKTLIDALRKPNNAAELRGNEAPQDGEDPFFVLLEDDKLMTGLSVETDTLLTSTPSGETDARDVHLVITVNVRPYNATTFNLSFV